jgi:hypothetical protein
MNKNASMSKNPDDIVLGNHETSKGYKRFPSTILVLEKCMIVVLQLLTHASQPSLLKMFLPTQILRLWQSAKGAQTEINGRKQLRLSLTHLKKRNMFSNVIHISPKIFETH